jgi:hypothetical protein
LLYDEQKTIYILEDWGIAMKSINKANKIKNISGKNAKHLIADMLTNIKLDIIHDLFILPNYSIGYPNQQKQFKMDFQISFPSIGHETWLIKSTNSVRDRIYGVEFAAQNIRIIDENVTKIFVVVPDSIPTSELRNKNNYAAKIHSDDYSSFLTDVLTLNELRNIILQHYALTLSQGLRANILGKDAEKEVVKLLRNDDNRELWNDYERNKYTVKSANFTLYQQILTAAKYNFGTDIILSVDATDNIPRLANGGQPKTDVSFSVHMASKSKVHNISIKNSSAKLVTIHEGKVSDLLIALKLPRTHYLAQALLKFEELGSEKELKNRAPEMWDILHTELSFYNAELIKFFLFGEKSPLITHGSQFADIMLYTNTLNVWNKTDYIDRYMSSYVNKGQFGTPFKWTYPSKKRGKKIQIKAFTNN